MIVYLILVNLEKYSDSIWQNVQWITLGNINNKMKWYPCPYDLDKSFGIISTTSFEFLSPEYMAYGSTETTPFKYIYAYYLEDVKQRWAELRNNKIIDKESLIKLVKTWVEKIGYDNLQLEYEKWSESPCNRNATINSKWELTGTQYISYNTLRWDNNITYRNSEYAKYLNRCYKSLQGSNIGHNPASSPEWWEDVTVKASNYNTGDKVFDGYNNFYEFEAKENVEVVIDSASNNRQDKLVNTPFTKLYSDYPNEGGVHDSLYRLYKWIDEQIAIIDSVFNYS